MLVVSHGFKSTLSILPYLHNSRIVARILSLNPDSPPQHLFFGRRVLFTHVSLVARNRQRLRAAFPPVSPRKPQDRQHGPAAPRQFANLALGNLVLWNMLSDNHFCIHSLVYRFQASRQWCAGQQIKIVADVSDIGRRRS
jgi:hypothetical protein